MITLENDKLSFSFPEVHKDAVCHINFQRTLRIPDDNQSYPLPPGLGRFPIEHVEDHVGSLPPSWYAHAGVLLPMYQSEALWINFSSFTKRYPFVIKIAAGKINAVTGDSWTDEISSIRQDYVVVPKQPWLDGFCIREGLVRQFVAMPLGEGYTAEEQLTGKAEFGGLQIIAYPMKRKVYERLFAPREVSYTDELCISESISYCTEMGLAPGGMMKQEIYSDHYGYEAWDTSVSSRCFVHLLNSSQWQSATGKPVPGKPPSAADYNKAGLPWFSYYADNATALGGSSKLSGMDSVAAQGIKKGQKPLGENTPLEPRKTVNLDPESTSVSEGNW